METNPPTADLSTPPQPLAASPLTDSSRTTVLLLWPSERDEHEFEALMTYHDKDASKTRNCKINKIRK